MPSSPPLSRGKGVELTALVLLVLGGKGCGLPLPVPTSCERFLRIRVEAERSILQMGTLCRMRERAQDWQLSIKTTDINPYLQRPAYRGKKLSDAFIVRFEPLSANKPLGDVPRFSQYFPNELFEFSVPRYPKSMVEESKWDAYQLFIIEGAEEGVLAPLAREDPSATDGRLELPDPWLPPVQAGSVPGAINGP